MKCASYWPAYPTTDQFMTAFIAERNRQWDLKQRFEDIKKKLHYFEGTNPSSAGKYLDSNYEPSYSDPENIDRLLNIIIGYQRCFRKTK